jgi:hypothetical protein
MSRGSYARRRTEVKRDESRHRRTGDDIADEYSSAAGCDDDEYERGPFLRKEQPANNSSLWAMRMREIVMEGRRKGLIRDAKPERVIDDWE